ncbi:TetR/AcrR family transcriptional regulator [Gelidibacter japonicus]|uniref:TetR/AcrR family transcriptional regulator n=1 Tax=Gelidibacter japonicus TaxID=1962232 RepID=UPI0013D771F9|nr:TetR/AcrR family transcriptional regulator [Gelidibacter japonicus]
MDKKELIEKVTDLFLENGPKTVTMDEVSKTLGMSKKTLYQLYKNKDELIEAVLSNKLDDVLEHLHEINRTVDNAIDRMFIRDENTLKAAERNKSLMHRQLFKYYPHIFNSYMLDFSEKFAEILVENIACGRKQGYYHNDFDPVLYAKLFFQLTIDYGTSPFIDTDKISREEYLKHTLQLYLNAITTEKGKAYIAKRGSEIVVK